MINFRELKTKSILFNTNHHECYKFKFSYKMSSKNSIILHPKKSPSVNHTPTNFSFSILHSVFHLLHMLSRFFFNFHLFFSSYFYHTQVEFFLFFVCHYDDDDYDYSCNAWRNLSHLNFRQISEWFKCWRLTLNEGKLD